MNYITVTLKVVMDEILAIQAKNIKLQLLMKWYSKGNLL